MYVKNSSQESSISMEFMNDFLTASSSTEPHRFNKFDFNNLFDSFAKSFM